MANVARETEGDWTCRECERCCRHRDLICPACGKGKNPHPPASSFKIPKGMPGRALRGAK